MGCMSGKVGKCWLRGAPQVSSLKGTPRCLPNLNVLSLLPFLPELQFGIRTCAHLIT